MEQGKSLSKNLLYTPLEAYFQHDADVASSTIKESSAKTVSSSQQQQQRQTTVVVHPSQYLNQLSSVPKSLHESSLASFLQSISQDYHRNRATPHDPKNNASRPLSVKDVDDRIKQRAVTLVSGGINASIAMHRRPKTTKKRRRQQSWEQVEGNCKLWTDQYSNGEALNDITFLRTMNTSWNEYIWDVLNIPISIDDLDDNKNIQRVQQRLNSCLMMASSDLELVGAHIKIASCDSHKSWTGRLGVLIGETTNTYRMAGLATTWTKNAKSKKEENIDHPSSHAKGMSITVLVIPKQGTSLILLLPIIPTDDRKQTPPEGSDDGDMLIPLSESTVCIRLKP
ncbi:hypothetical protein IV203_021360 [Nitzschia inconspicua]|uniref:Uncharacterized protein n=1 Tax=Nitzschia inconspicua TaxID=303405 RepID=A0A9K3KH07_9STRA|nr:hypothetical protein IV203_021360 [Nitzschia inconspicua]